MLWLSSSHCICQDQGRPSLTLSELEGSDLKQTVEAQDTVLNPLPGWGESQCAWYLYSDQSWRVLLGKDDLNLPLRAYGWGQPSRRQGTQGDLLRKGSARWVGRR